MRFLKTFLIVLSVFVLTHCGDDNPDPITPSTAPTIISISPANASRGQRNATITIVGTNLSAVTGVAMGSEITVHRFRQISATQLDVDFSVSTSAAAGIRTISVITPNGTATSTSAFNVLSNVVPVALFTVKPGNGNEKDVFEFDASASHDTNGTIVEYHWEFNDGKPHATGQTVTRTFSPGDYDVTLTVTDNNGTTSVKTRKIEVEEFKEIVCKEGVRNRGLIYGTVIRVEGNDVILQLEGPKATCANSYYECGDMRDAEVDLGFFGIITSMSDMGDNTFRVHNSCPYHWPPKIGQRVFLFKKTCEENHC